MRLTDALNTLLDELDRVAGQPLEAEELAGALVFLSVNETACKLAVDQVRGKVTA